MTNREAIEQLQKEIKEALNTEDYEEGISDNPFVEIILLTAMTNEHPEKLEEEFQPKYPPVDTWDWD